MQKKKIEVFGVHYLLGIDNEGIKHYLQKPSWDCGWYWGFGYIHTFTNNRAPEMSRDINSHYHWDSFKDYPHPNHLIETPFTKNEWYTLRELAKTIYTLRETAEVFGRGGAHITNNPLADEIKNPELVEHINKVLIPKLWEEMEKILKED